MEEIIRKPKEKHLQEEKQGQSERQMSSSNGQQNKYLKNCESFQMRVDRNLECLKIKIKLEMKVKLFFLYKNDKKKNKSKAAH